MNSTTCELARGDRPNPCAEHFLSAPTCWPPACMCLPVCPSVCLYLFASTCWPPTCLPSTCLPYLFALPVGLYLLASCLLASTCWPPTCLPLCLPLPVGLYLLASCLLASYLLALPCLPFRVGPSVLALPCLNLPVSTHRWPPRIFGELPKSTPAATSTLTQVSSSSNSNIDFAVIFSKTS